MRHYNLVLLGFGNVGRALGRLLEQKRSEIRERYGASFTITGIASRRLGWLTAAEGLDVEAAVAGALAGTAWDDGTLAGWLAAARADVVFENTSMDPQTGQPAIGYLETALRHGAHVITANKGPVVHAYQALSDLAARQGKRFLFEAAVMGGAPIFSLFREALPGAQLKRFQGILNSTTNLILAEMEAGQTYEAAVRRAQEVGVAETDPSNDVDGWDAAVKVAALATVLMGVRTTPQEVAPTGIRALSGEQVRAARASGRPYKLICSGEKLADGHVRASVAPRQVEADDPLAYVNGTTSMVTFELDTLHALSVSEKDGDAVTTAYGPLADFLTIVREEAR